MTTLFPNDSIRLPFSGRGFLLVALACLALLPTASALLPPPVPDGGYPGENTAEGDQALFNVQISIGNNTGLHNTALGFQALHKNTVGNENTAIGWKALWSNVGVNNTATGYRPLEVNTTGINNTADGGEALLNNLTGKDNTATGYRALFSNTTKSENTANGSLALRNNTGSRNTATGCQALLSALSGSAGDNNTAAGYQALLSNSSGSGNTADGYAALAANTAGNQNTAIGQNALVGATGSTNTALGQQAGSHIKAGSNNIDIGNQGDPNDGAAITTPPTIRIGDSTYQKRTFIAGISGITTGKTNAIPVMVDSMGQLGTVNSSERFKKDIKPMNQSSDVVLGLKPVTFHYKNDSTNTPQFGLVAEEVEKANPDLVVRDAEGKVFTVRYDAVNAMLLNEFLKEHRKVEELETTVAQQQETMKTLAAGLAKVSAQIDATKPATRLVQTR
jgi:hypothetical protein